RGAGNVGVSVVPYLIHALSDPFDGREMKNGVYALQSFSYIFRFAHIPDLQLHLGMEISGPLRRRAMYLFRKIIQRPYRISMLNQFIGYMRSDETSSPC